MSHHLDRFPGLPDAKTKAQADKNYETVQRVFGGQDSIFWPAVIGLGAIVLLFLVAKFQPAISALFH